MKKLTLIFAILLPILMGACTSDGFDNPNVSEGNEVSVIEAIMTPFGDVQSESRTAIDMSDSKVNSLVWAEGDTIGIYPSAGGDQLSFPITDGIGTGTCIFTGGGWALKTSTDTETYKYTAYSPFNRKYYLLNDNTALPINMLGQKQNGNDSSKHLGAYHIQIASGETPTSGKISFKFKHKVSFVRMDITAPCAATWKSIELESDAAFTTKATMNLSLDVPTVTPTAQSNSVTLELENVKTTESNLSIVAYMMMLPVDFNDKTLTMKLTDVDNNVYSASVEIRNPNNAANPRLFGEATSRWISAEFKEGTETEDIPYLTFIAAATQTLTMSKEVQTLEYSVGGSKWASLGTKTVTFGGSNGDLRLRGKSAMGTCTTSYNDYSKFSFGNSTSVSCSGDIRTLVDYENYATAETKDARFCSVFANCSNLISAPELPASTLAYDCYLLMFDGCSNLTTAPELPATTLADQCYGGMFRGCTSLTSAPVLPATNLAGRCYNGMFMNCTNLTKAPQLPATELKYMCYMNMFDGCINLTTAPELRAVTLAENCYSQMFAGCTNLTTAPKLPAKTLEWYCYDRMFKGCSKLKEVTILATDISAEGCLTDWLSSVSSTGTFIKSPQMKSLPTGSSGIPSGWTVVDCEDDGNLENPEEGEESEW